MSKGKVTVLGINGHIGRAAARAFVDAGWSVSGMARTNRAPLPGVTFIKGDAGVRSDIEAAIAGADVVMNALNLPYDKWDKGRAEAQLATVIAAMGDSGKTMMYPGNVYNYAATDRVMTPATPQHPETPRGAIRVRQEQMLERAAKAGKFQAIIIRAGDFFGPDNTGDWFDQAMMMDVSKGKIHHMGGLETAHTWAYLPDLGAAFAQLAEQRQTLAAFENFHFEGHYVTHGALMAAIQNAAPRPVTVTPLNWLMFQLLSLAVPILREVLKMRYLWNNPMKLSDSRLEAMLGPDFGTPLNAAVAASVGKFFVEKKLAA
ncbi:NAD-dependent epimerase/dehydratase family protein [Devosia sp.]|uniref:NAD-dependent epimerase/dehydratase family protein n=1 Tax=Devosia sp. TaxID=1871048 RepID=UPI003265D0EB